MAHTQARGRWVLVSSCGIALLLGVLALGSVVLPYEQVAMRQRWASAHPRHYDMRARWRSGGWVMYSSLEVRNEQLVAGTNLFDGSPLTAIDLGVMSAMFPVDHTFGQIDVLRRWPTSWRTGIARLVPVPMLARTIDPCVVPLPRVTYDQALGYPREVHAFTNPCYNGVGYDLEIEALQPLP